MLRVCIEDDEKGDVNDADGCLPIRVVRDEWWELGGVLSSLIVVSFDRNI